MVYLLVGTRGIFRFGTGYWTRLVQRWFVRYTQSTDQCTEGATRIRLRPAADTQIGSEELHGSSEGRPSEGRPTGQGQTAGKRYFALESVSLIRRKVW